MSNLVDASLEVSQTNQTGSYSGILDLSDIDIITLQPSYSATSQSAAVVASASISGNVFTKTNHGLVTGVVGQFTTSSALPTPLATSTNYYIIRLSANTFSVADSLAHAQAGTAITLSDAGTGNQTFTPTSASGVLKLQESVDGTNFIDVSGDTVTITTTGSALWKLNPVYCRYLKILFTPTSGVINFSVTINARNNTARSNAYVVPPISVS